MLSYIILVVESTTNQSFVTRKLIKETKCLNKNSPYKSATEFPNFLKYILQDRYLHFDRNRMDTNALKLFIEYGLKIDVHSIVSLCELDEAIDAARKQNEERKAQETNSVIEDIEIIRQMVSIKLCAFDRYISFKF